jgi:hypothetical protein
MRVAVIVCLAACAEPHVTLKAPAPTIGPDERVAMFKALERADEETLRVSRNHGPWELEGARLVLADGTKVELPEDLLPVVAPESDTARAARASAATGHRANTWMYIGFGALAASLATIGAVELGGADIGVSDDWLFVGAAVATGIPFFAARHERHEEMQLRVQAFSTYTRDLGLRLDVCAHGLEVIACETPVTPNAPGMVPPSVPGTVPPSDAPGAAAPAVPAPAPSQPAPSEPTPAAQ